ncbi:CASP-like protein 4A3 isoform X1 [Juglans microcarpa x Juglans regia]|uniref:CASP-like protein 4A3 isoform X1 n=1 Tax=Juglans microcarpa x Juglans regia TaxID=2249226 RepID=UPI001B7EB655|nr:CASP-like protein 4A3 isoform X1 [Juglans microcarpa x Juglans regia]
MDKDKRADKEAAEEEEEEEEEKHTQYVKKAEQKPEEEQEKDAISDPSPPTTRSPPPQSHRYHKPSSAPLDSSSPSSLSSDHSSHSHELKRSTAPAPDTPPEVVANRSLWTNTVVLDKVDPGAQDGFSSVREVEAGRNSRGVSTDGGGGSRRLRPNLSILRRARRDNMVKKTLLWLRIFAFVFCLISFSVMAADKNQGWALDSFQRYKEFRYCMAVNVVGFAYSGLQAYDLVNYFINGKHIVWHHLRYYFDFSMDQVLTYLLISASSSAATRVYDWQSNWGKDKFPEMASASVGLSFVAFVAFALSSLFSGYTLFKTS